MKNPIVLFAGFWIAEAQFNRPIDIVINARTQTLFVSEENRIRRVQP